MQKGIHRKLKGSNFGFEGGTVEQPDKRNHDDAVYVGDDLGCRYQKRKKSRDNGGRGRKKVTLRMEADRILYGMTKRLAPESETDV